MAKNDTIWSLFSLEQWRHQTDAFSAHMIGKDPALVRTLLDWITGAHDVKDKNPEVVAKFEADRRRLLHQIRICFQAETLDHSQWEYAEQHLDLHQFGDPFFGAKLRERFGLGSALEVQEWLYRYEPITVRQDSCDGDKQQ